ncbi:hypothetical protein H2203_005071 [Taxawa tesnikishii (nom. ined.)]|nr:hypothetical protein H2203_005071 [Dothideales sp. JES 119]
MKLNDATAVAYTNTTSTATPSSSYVTAAPSGSCVADCSANPWGPSEISWTKQFPNVTLTAATVVYVVNNQTNTTRTTTLYADLPPGFTPPPTNSGGYRILEVTLPIVTDDYGNYSSSTVTMTYPTMYMDYPKGYNFSGTIPTSVNGEPVCLTAPSSGIWITLPPAPTTSVLSTDPEDPYGLLYTTAAYFQNYATEGWARVFPSEAAFTECTQQPASAVAATLPTANATPSNPPSAQQPAPEAATATAPESQSPALQSQNAQTATAAPSPQADRTQASPAGPAASTGSPDVGAAILSVLDGGPKPATSSVGTNADGTGRDLQQTPAGSSTPSSSEEPVIPAAAPIVVGGTSYLPTPVNPGAASAYVVQGQTLAADQPVTVGSGSSAVVVSLQTAAGHTQLIVGGSTSETIADSSTPTNVPAPLVVGGQTLSAVASSGYVVGSQTLAPDHPVTLGSGTSAVVVSLATDAGHTQLVVGGSTSNIAGSSAATAPPAPVVIAGQTLSAGPSSEYVVDGQTLVPGSSITVGSGPSATIVALTTNSKGQSVAVVGGTTSPLGNGVSVTTPAPVIVNGQTFAPGPSSEYVVAGQTLSLGSSITIGSGSATTLVALSTDSQGRTVAVVGSSISVLPDDSGAPTATPAPLVVDGQTFTLGPSSEYVDGSRTLALGSSIRLGSGSATTVVALTTDTKGETVAVIGSSTSVLVAAATTPAPLVLDGQTFTLGPSSDYVDGSQTLALGSSIILGSGTATTLVALTTDNQGRTVVVEGSSTSVVGQVSVTGKASATATSAAATVVSKGTASASAPNTGDAARMIWASGWVVGGCLLLAAVL